MEVFRWTVLYHPRVRTIRLGPVLMNVCVHVNWVTGIAGVVTGPVRGDVRSGPADAPTVVLLVIGGGCGALRKRAVGTAAVRGSCGRAVQLVVLRAAVFHPIEVVTPRTLHQLTVYGA